MAKWGTFQGTVRTEWVGDGRQMILLEPLHFVRHNGERYTARPGLIFDGASIPTLFWHVIGSPFTGPYREAAVIHDQLCVDGRFRVCPVPSHTVHLIFYEAIRARGGSALRAWAMWVAVRLFGPRFPARSKT